MDINELDSFNLGDAVKFHDNLNPNLWIDDKLDPEVRDQLLLIAQDFVSTLGISDLDIQDITVSGSNAAFSYTPHSDLDLHIVVHIPKLHDEVYKELFTAKKTLYNDSHDITVHGVPVELYVQDMNEPVQSLGEYSVLDDKWIHVPKKKRANFDEVSTKAKFENLKELVELALKTKSLDRVEKTIDTIRRYRKAGLHKAGEFSPENLAFKAIRSQGGIDALYDLRNDLRSKKLSIEEAADRDDAILKIKKLLNTSGRTENEKENIKSIVYKMMQQWNITPEELGIRQPVDPLKAKLARAAYEKQMAHDAMSAEWEKFKGKIKGIFAENEQLDKPELTIPELAKKHNVSTLEIRDQLKKGIAVELEHTSHHDVAREIALDHIAENPKYYDKLAKVELEEEPLNETTQESQLINSISKKAANIIVKTLSKNIFKSVADVMMPDIKKQKLEIYGISAEQLGIPYTNDPVLSQVLSHSKFRVIDYINPLSPGTLASYNNITHDIIVYYPTIKRSAKIQEYTVEELLAKTIAHELQHAVDDVKSRGEVFNPMGAYMTLPYEINARFQEALLNIAMVLDNAKKNNSRIDKTKLPKLIDTMLRHNSISQYLPREGKRYKRLVARSYKFFEAEMNKPTQEKPMSLAKRALNYVLGKPTGTINEASGYIPSEEEKNDPRWKTALTKDVRPDANKKNAAAFGWKVSRAGIPPQARADGKIAEDLMKEWNSFLAEDQEQQELFPGYDKEHRQKRLDNWLQNTHAWDGHKPMTFYHATTKDFDTFNTHGTGFASALGMAFEVERHGSFFAVDPKFAESFIEDPNTGNFKEGGRIIPVYLSVQNPIDLRDNNLSYMLRDDETVDGFKANGIDLRSIYYHIGEYDRWELFDGPEGAEFVDNLQKLGFDGAIINEIVPNNNNAKSGEVWVVFNPNQVKSIRNRGSFSPDDPSLMKENY